MSHLQQTQTVEQCQFLGICSYYLATGQLITPVTTLTPQMIVTVGLEGTEVFFSFHGDMDQMILRKFLVTHDTKNHMHKEIFVNKCFPYQQLWSLFSM